MMESPGWKPTELLLPVYIDVFIHRSDTAVCMYMYLPLRNEARCFGGVTVALLPV